MKHILLILALLPFLATAQDRPPKSARKTTSQLTGGLYENFYSGAYDKARKKSIPYKSVADANKAIPKNDRVVADQIIYVGDSSKPTLYWYWGGREDHNLVPVYSSITVSTPSMDGRINILDLGCIPNYNPGVSEALWDDCGKKIQRYIDSLPPYSRPKFRAPAGWFWSKNEITLKDNKGIDIVGEPVLPYVRQASVATTFYFGLWNQPVNGFNLTNTSLPGSSIQYLRMMGTATPQTQKQGKRVSGIYYEQVADLRYNFIQNFSNGIYGYGAVAQEGGAGGNVSLSTVKYNRISECMENAIYAGGTDANFQIIEGNVLIQNYGWGGYDNGFLGNNWLYNQTATNGRSGSEDMPLTGGGGIAIAQPTSQASVTGQYNEGDQGPNYVHPGAGMVNVHGGINPAGWVGSFIDQPYQPAGGNIKEGIYENKSRVEDFGAQHMHMSRQIKVRNNTPVEGVNLKPTNQFGERPRIGFYMEDNTPFIEMIAPGVPHTLLGKPAGNQVKGKSSLPVPSVAITGDIIINGFLHHYGKTTDPDIIFQPGAFVWPLTFDPEQPEHWRCIKAGRNYTGSADFTYTELGNVGGDMTMQYIKLKNRENYRYLKVGDRITLSGNKAQAEVRYIDTMFAIEVSKPNMLIRDGDRISLGRGFEDPHQPVSYTESTITLVFKPEQRIYKAGDTVIFSHLPTTIKSVRMEHGIMYITPNFPEGAEAHWYQNVPLNRVPFQQYERLWPVAYDFSDKERPLVTIALPTPFLEEGALLPINDKFGRVHRIITEGIQIAPLPGYEGKIWPNQPPASFTIQTPLFKAYGN